MMHMSKSAAAPRSDSVAELTVRAVAAGIFFGLLFGAANAYLGLRVGLTVSTSIPIAVLTVALFRVMRSRRDVLLEANLSQTIVSATSSLAPGAFELIPSALSLTLPVLPKPEVDLEIAPALLAVGYILGYRQSAIMVSGSLISAIVLTPLIAVYSSGPVAVLTAGQIWSKHVRFIGAGAVAAAGLVAVARALPTMWSSFAAVVRGLRRSGVDVAGGGAEGSGEHTS